MHFPLYTVATCGFVALAHAKNFPHTRRSGTTIPLVATEFGTVFDAPVTIGGQEFQLLVDTGSSDTYVMRNGYKCIGRDNQPAADCLYSNKTYHVSDTYDPLPDTMFGIQYGAGLASGEMAYENVSIGGISTAHQKIGVANVSNPMGDKVNSGLLGLAYPALSSAHPASHTSNKTYWFDRLVYDPLLFTLHQEGKMDPYFSIALAHTPQNTSKTFGGYLTLGGLPPVNHSTFTTVPVERIRNIPTSFTSDKKSLAYWATTVRGVTYGHGNNLTTNSTSFQAFVDSGNYFSILPAGIVDPIHALFSSKPVWSDDLSAFTVDCSASVPEFGITIGNQTFWHDGRDLIYQTSDGVCMSSLVSSERVPIGDLTLNVIGVAFLKSVVAVFDFGKDEMRFAKTMKAKGGK